MIKLIFRGLIEEVKKMNDHYRITAWNDYFHSQDEPPFGEGEMGEIDYYHDNLGNSIVYKNGMREPKGEQDE